MLRLLLMFGIAALTQTGIAQSYAFGLKLGPSIGIQNWNNYQTNEPLFKYHILAFIESAPEENTGTLFAELGYHIKGRAIRFRATVNPLTGGVIPARNFKLQFRNISFQLGGRQKIPVGNNRLFYSLAIRGDYNVSSDLEIYAGFKEGINKLTYGISVGGGMEFEWSELVSGILDIRVSPDLSKQIFIPPFEWQNPYTGTQEVFREQSVKNIVFEVSLGIRFLHKIIYVD